MRKHTPPRPLYTLLQAAALIRLGEIQREVLFLARFNLDGPGFFSLLAEGTRCCADSLSGISHPKEASHETPR